MWKVTEIGPMEVSVNCNILLLLKDHLQWQFHSGKNIMMVMMWHIPIIFMVILVETLTRLLLAMAVVDKDFLLQHTAVQLSDNSAKEQCLYSSNTYKFILQKLSI